MIRLCNDNILQSIIKVDKKEKLEFEIITSDVFPQPIYNKHINNILSKAKDKIDNNKNWDNGKKLSNCYELIHLPCKKNKNDSIALYNPLSRSYFKMWEILKKFKLVEKFKKEIIVSSIAEGPGGFIEALINYRKQFNFIDSYNAITLQSNKNEIPGWKKSKNYLLQNTNIKIHYGEDGTGNIYNVSNIIHYAIKNGKNKSHIVTADGGFDFSIDFNKQEQLAYRLILCEIVTTFCVQINGGNSVIKIFDTYTKMSISLLYILANYYDEIILYKPDTSRPANSEKYVICRNFKGISSSELGKLLHIIHNWDSHDNGNNLFIHDIIKNNIPNNFIKDIVILII